MENAYYKLKLKSEEPMSTIKLNKKNIDAIKIDDLEEQIKYLKSQLQSEQVKDYKTKLENLKAELAKSYNNDFELAIKQRHDFEHEFHQDEENKRVELGKLEGEIEARKAYIKALDEIMKTQATTLKSLIDIVLKGMGKVHIEDNTGDIEINNEG